MDDNASIMDGAGKKLHILNVDVLLISEEMGSMVTSHPSAPDLSYRTIFFLD